MNTTLIFAELLIIGLEGGIWLTFLLLSFFGIDGLDEFLLITKDWQLILLTLAIPLIYALGIILDRAGDRLFKTVERKIEREIIGDFPVKSSVMRFALNEQNHSLNEQLEYTRSRIRVIRASALNFVLITVSISTFLLIRIKNISPTLRWEYVAFTIIAGLFFAYASFLSWKFLIKGYLKLVKAMYEYQNPQVKKKTILKS